MAAAIKVRTDCTSEDLRRFACRCGDVDQVRRLLALASILDGGSRCEAAKVAGVTLQIVQDWILRSNSGGPAGRATRKAAGELSILNDEQRTQLAEDRAPRDDSAHVTGLLAVLATLAGVAISVSGVK